MAILILNWINDEKRVRKYKKVIIMEDRIDSYNSELQTLRRQRREILGVKGDDGQYYWGTLECTKCNAYVERYDTMCSECGKELSEENVLIAVLNYYAEIKSLYNPTVA
jgi:hypothetical protein